MSYKLQRPFMKLTSASPIGRNGSFHCFFFFFNFWHGKVRQNLSTPLEKNALKSVKLLILKVMRAKTTVSQRGEILQTLVWWGVGGQVCFPHHTNLCKISRLCAAISSWFFNKSLSSLAILLILKFSCQWCQKIFPNLPKSKDIVFFDYLYKVLFLISWFLTSYSL